MKPTPQHVQNVYLALTLINTLAASFIWGVNTLFLLDAGLSNTQAFLANAFFTVGQVMFEVPTGMVADLKGRRTSYLLGTLTLALSTLLYLAAWYVQAPFWWWAASSVLLGLGFTFFSGATEAWLVDSLKFAGYKGELEKVFAKGQSLGGVAMLVGSVAGGVVAQATNLGVPYWLRAGLLVANFGVALVFMKDWGFTPSVHTNLKQDFQQLFTRSVQFGWQHPPVRWLMLTAPFMSGVGFYAFYAMQPLLLELYQDDKAYAIAGLAAALVAGAQILGGLSAAYLSRWFKLRTSVLIVGGGVASALLIIIGSTHNFWLAVACLCVWGLVFAATQPVRQAFLNQLIPSQQRATVLSFDSLLGSSGGVVIQPGLGRVADLHGYPASLVGGGLIQVLALPLLWLARRERVKADRLTS